VLNDALHVVWSTWLEEAAFFSRSACAEGAVEALVALMSRKGAFSSAFKRYRLADVLVQMHERDVSEGKPEFDGRLTLALQSALCQRELVPALAEVYMDVALVTPSDAHVFDHNASRGRICSLIIYLLTTSQPMRHSLHEFVADSHATSVRSSRASRESWGVEFLDSVLTDGMFVTKASIHLFMYIYIYTCMCVYIRWHVCDQGS
jgi:hypothetical protein